MTIIKFTEVYTAYDHKGRMEPATPKVSKRELAINSNYIIEIKPSKYATKWDPEKSVNMFNLPYPLEFSHCLSITIQLGIEAVEHLVEGNFDRVIAAIWEQEDRERLVS